MGKEYVKAVYCYPVYLYVEYIMQNARLDESKTGIKISSIVLHYTLTVGLQSV